MIYKKIKNLSDFLGCALGSTLQLLPQSYYYEIMNVKEVMW